MEPLSDDDPERVGPYALLARLGAGGMGTVYLALAPGGRKVAVKVVKAGLAKDAEFRDRFRREVEAAREVSGAFTAAVLDAGPDAPEPWLAAAYVPGMTLKEAVEACGPLPPEALRALATGLAEALAAIHRAGLVHRDLKPANVMLTAGGPKVIDFGIVRPEDATGITQPGTAIGTPVYMSPEQAAGRRVRPSGDLFSLGVVLHYAATGRPGFDSGRPEPGTDPARALPDRALARIAAACLEPDPARRPTAEKLLERLGGDPVPLHGTDWLPEPVAVGIARREAEPIPSRTPTEAAPPSPKAAMGTLDAPSDFGPAPAPPRRIGRRAVVAGGLSAAGLLAAGAAWALWPDGAAEPQTAEPPEGSASPAATGEPSPSAPPPEAVPRWSVQVGVFGPTVTAAGGLIVAVADDRLQALDPATGAVAWEREAVVRAAVADGRLYTVDESIYPWALTALDAASGGVEWSRSTEFLPWQGPFACGELLCVGSEAVAALRADGGGQVWYAEVNPENGLVANDDIVVAAHAVLEGLDPRTGDTAWTYEMDTASSPSLGDGMVVACDAEGVVHAVRTEDGAAVWTRPTGSFGHRFLYGDGVLYAQAGGGDTLALRADTGEELWAVQSGGGEGDPYGTTNLLRPADGALYVCGTDRTAYALDLADGSTLWTWDAGETFTAPPVPLDGLVFVGTSDGRVHALEPATER